MKNFLIFALVLSGIVLGPDAVAQNVAPAGAQDLSAPAGAHSVPPVEIQVMPESGAVQQMSPAFKKVPDNEAIWERIADSQSPFFYDALMMRYRAGDTSLTVEDYHYLYYGFAFQQEYDPLVPIEAENDILAVLERVGVAQEPAHPDNYGMEQIIYSALEVMERDPFSPSNLNYLTYAYGALGDTLNERVNHDRFVKVLEVIGASGDGLKEKTPMHIIRFSHGADYLAAQGLGIAKRIVISRSVEFIELTEKEGKIRGYFFDYSRIYSRRPSQLPEKPKREWQIDGFPVK